MQEVLDALAGLNPKPIQSLSAEEARLQPSPADAVLQIIQDRGDAAPKRLPPVGRVEMREIPGLDGNRIPVRVYSPPGKEPHPVIVYYHGGGWVLGSIDAYDSSIRALSDMANAVVVAVDYRKAPEHRFPAAHRDSYAALQYVMENAEQFYGDPRRVAVAGESAGGNLATAVCLMAKARGGQMPVHQVLIYPVTDHSMDSESYRQYAEAKPLNADMMKWFFRNYLANAADGEKPVVSPLSAGQELLRGLPPATVITAEIDPLRDDGLAYARRLESAGIEVTTRNYPGVTHEFFGMSAVLDEAEDAQELVAERLRAAFEERA
jgi:acetyl esterase